MPEWTRASALAAVMTLVVCGGCATPPQTSSPVASSEYATTFSAAMEALRDMGFELARVDARSGVITTRPRSSSGLATPWMAMESSVGQSVEGLLNHQRRVVEVRFVAPGLTAGHAPPPEEAEASPAPIRAPPGVDLRTLEAPLEVHVSVRLERLHREGLRVQPAAIKLSSFADDPVTERVAGGFSVADAGDDDLLAARVLERIRREAGALSREANDDAAE